MALYSDGQDAKMSEMGGSSMGGNYGDPSATYFKSNDEAKRFRRDNWIEQSDPNYWLKAWEERAKKPEEASTMAEILKYNGGSPEAWAQNQAETAQRQYANDLDRDADRKRNKRNALIAMAGMGALSAATSAGAFAGAAGAGTTAGTTAAGVGKGVGFAGQAAGMGATKGAIAAGAAGQAGAAGGLGAAGAAGAAGTAAGAGGGLTMATVPTIATGATGTGAIAVPSIAGAGGAGAAAAAPTISAGSGAGLGTYGKWANTALQGYNSYASAKEQQELAKQAAKGTTTTRTPYMNDALSKIVRYILEEQAKTYANRMRRYGVTAGDYSPFAALLAQIPQSYTGVGR